MIILLTIAILIYPSIFYAENNTNIEENQSQEISKTIKFENDIKELDKIETDEEKIIFLESLLSNYTKDEFISILLIRLGDLRPRKLSIEDEEDTPDGYFYDESSGTAIYKGPEYDQVIKKFPAMEYAAEAAYKKLSLLQGGECEGDIGCFFDTNTYRGI